MQYLALLSVIATLQGMAIAAPAHPDTRGIDLSLKRDAELSARQGGIVPVPFKLVDGVVEKLPVLKREDPVSGVVNTATGVTDKLPVVGDATNKLPLAAREDPVSGVVNTATGVTEGLPVVGDVTNKLPLAARDGAVSGVTNELPVVGDVTNKLPLAARDGESQGLDVGAGKLLNLGGSDVPVAGKTVDEIVEDLPVDLKVDAPVLPQ